MIAPAMAAVAITAVVVSNLSIWFLPFAPVTRADSRTLTSAELLQKHRENDEDADESALPIGIDARHEQPVADHFEQGRSNKSPVSSALTSHQIGAADHRRGDHPQLIAYTKRVDGRTLPADDENGCNRCRQARYDKGLHLDRI